MSNLDLIPSEEKALAVFTSDNGLDPFINKIREELDLFVSSADTDMSSSVSRKKIASMAHKIAMSKTTLDDAGKKLTGKLKEMPRLVDRERKRMRDLLDKWKDEVRKPLTDWESLEEERVNEIKCRISSIERFQFVIFYGSAGIKYKIEEIKSTVIDDSFLEFKGEAESVKNKTLVNLHDRFEQAVSIEREEEKRREEESRKKKIEESEMIAINLRLQEEKFNKELLEQKEKSILDIQEAEERLKLELELKNKKETEERIKREGDKNHRTYVLDHIYNDFIIKGFDPLIAAGIVDCLEKGVISHVEIVY